MFVDGGGGGGDGCGFGNFLRLLVCFLGIGLEVGYIERATIPHLSSTFILLQFSSPSPFLFPLPSSRTPKNPLPFT